MSLAAIAQPVELPLFQEEDDGATPISPLKFTIRHVSHLTASRQVERWHYSRRMPTGKNYPFGLFAGTTLYAVIVYGIGVNPYRQGQSERRTLLR